MKSMLAAKTFFETPVARLTPQMEQDFFSSLLTSNKTYKTTYHKRFSDANPCILQHLQNKELQPIKVLDIGISSGISTAELYDDLSAGGLNVKIIATDILIDAFLVRVLPKCHVLIDQDGFPLRFDLPFATMKPWVVRRDYRNGFFVFRKAINLALTHRARKILLNAGDRRITEVRLVTPRLLANKDITVRYDDICRYNGEFADSFDFIRAANILNNGYFSPDVLASMVTNIGSYLSKPSGLLLVVRTHNDDSNHGTLFRLGDDHRFEVVRRIGDGSEIENIVLQSAIPAR